MRFPLSIIKRFLKQVLKNGVPTKWEFKMFIEGLSLIEVDRRILGLIQFGDHDEIDRLLPTLIAERLGILA